MVKRGLAAWRSSYPQPNRSSTPARKFSTITSAVAASRRNTSGPPGAASSIDTLRTLRARPPYNAVVGTPEGSRVSGWSRKNVWRRASGRAWDSIFTTSRPSSARSRAAVLPATKAPKVMTRSSLSGRSTSAPASAPSTDDGSDKARLPPLGHLGLRTAQLARQHGHGVVARRDGHELGRVERPVGVDRCARYRARPELRMGQRAEGPASVAPLVGEE